MSKICQERFYSISTALPTSYHHRKFVGDLLGTIPLCATVCRASRVVCCVCVLTACDLFRANGARLPAWPSCASFRPLDNLQVGLGAKSGASRHNPEGSAPLAGAKEVAVTPSEFAAGRPSPAFPRALASGPVRRSDAPVVRRAVRGARLRRRIRLLVPLASRIGGPTNRLAAPLSASRSASPPLANAQSLRRVAP